MIVPEYKSRNQFIRYLFNKRLDIALELVSQYKSQVLEIVEIGAGDGFFLNKLTKETRWSIMGTDVIETPHPLLGDDIQESRLRGNRFDIVFCLDVLEHLPQLDKAIGHIKRILKPNGLLGCSLPTQNLLYKTGRFLLKGTTSMETAPSTSPHLYTARHIEKRLATQLNCIKKRNLLWLFNITLWQKS